MDISRIVENAFPWDDGLANLLKRILQPDPAHRISPTSAVLDIQIQLFAPPRDSLEVVSGWLEEKRGEAVSQAESMQMQGSIADMLRADFFANNTAAAIVSHFETYP